MSHKLLCGTNFSEEMERNEMNWIVKFHEEHFLKHAEDVFMTFKGFYVAVQELS